MRIVVSIVVIIVNAVSCFNLDTQSPYIVKSSAEADYFGYSVALHKNDDGNFLMVGAPTSATPQPGITHGGAVFKCQVPEILGDPSGVAVCSEQLTVLDEEGNKFVSKDDINDFSYNESDIYSLQSEQKSNQWLGVTLQSNLDSDNLLGCAHRYESRYLGIPSFWSDPPRQLTGKCVLLNRELDWTESVYEPCKGMESGYTKVGNCQVGTSAHWSDRKLVLGAPGSYEGSGGLYITETDDILVNYGTTNPYKDPEFQNSLPYIGYSTTICDMNGDGVKDVISGGPRGKLYKGQVVIYQEYKTPSKSELILVHELPFELIGEQMGSFYGSSLLCQDMNGDGIDDLLVGAPWYTDTEYLGQGMSKPDAGRIYFYPGAPKFDMFDELEFLPLEYDLTLIQKITGTEELETLGLTLSSAGDVNNDGAYDLLVGSPYFNGGEGKVSLFLGGINGIETTPSQIITPTKLGILDGLRGFGWSIAGGKDMDSNGISDVAIGSFLSQHVVLLRSVPIIDVNVTIGIYGNDVITELDPLREPTLDIGGGNMAQGINLQACFEYIGISGARAPDGTAVATVNFKLTLDSTQDLSEARMYTNYTDPSQVYSSSINVDLQNNMTICTAAIPAYYKGEIGYSSQAVIFSMEAELEKRDTFAERAVLNQQLIHDADFKLGIASDCPKDTGVCVAELGITVEEVKYKNMDKYPITIGLVKEITVPVTVLNKGPNTAYGPILTVDAVPGILPFTPHISNKCNSTYHVELKGEDMYNITCVLSEDRKIKAGESITVPLYFNLTKLLAPQKFEIAFTATVVEPSIKASATGGFTVFNLHVVNLADLKVAGGSSPSTTAYNNKYGVANKVLGYDGPVIRHKYDISLSDDSINYIVRNITFSIWWPSTFPGGAYLFPLERVTFPNINETEAQVYCDHQDLLITRWDLMSEAIFHETEQIYTNLSCKENRTLCQKITCNLEYLERGAASFKIVLTTRLQEYFLNGFEDLSVSSLAELESVEETMTLPSFVSSSATSFLSPSRSRSVNYWWIIVIAVIAALLILLLLIFILWKFKFFKRANLQPEPEPPTVVGYLTSYGDDDGYNYNRQEKVLLPE